MTAEVETGYELPAERGVIATTFVRYLPLLILAENPPADAGDRNGTHFVNSTDRILELLTERHGFPRLHK